MSDEEIDMNTLRVLVQPRADNQDSWGFKSPCYWLSQNSSYITIEENGFIYRVPWAAINYIREFAEMKNTEKQKQGGGDVVTSSRN